MSVYALLADLLTPESPVNRPQSPQSRPAETVAAQGKSPESPKSPALRDANASTLDSAKEALEEATEERAAILECDAGLPRAQAEREARQAYKVFQYRLPEAPNDWIALLCPNGADLAEATEWARRHHGDKVIEVRPYQPAGPP